MSISSLLILVVTLKNLVTAIKCHHHLEESTVGHARLVGLAGPVDLLNPDKAVHGEEHT